MDISGLSTVSYCTYMFIVRSSIPVYCGVYLFKINEEWSSVDGVIAHVLFARMLSYLCMYVPDNSCATVSMNV